MVDMRDRLQPETIALLEVSLPDPNAAAAFNPLKVSSGEATLEQPRRALAPQTSLMPARIVVQPTSRRPSVERAISPATPPW